MIVQICFSDQIKCSKCGKIFGHHQILQLHMKFHNMSQPESKSVEEQESKYNSFSQETCVNNAISDTETTSTNEGIETSVSLTEDNLHQRTKELTSSVNISSAPLEKYSSVKNRSKSKKGKSIFTKCTLALM